MNAKESPFQLETSEEISALIATLHQTSQRLEELTTGEVDAVADHEGRTFVLRHVQEQSRHIEAAKQVAALEALRVSEERFRQIAENIRDVFFLQSVDGSQIHYVSNAYEAIWGRTRDSLYANPRSWADAIHPDDHASTCEKYREGMPTGTFESEYRILRPDGSIRWIEAKGVPVYDDHGKIVRIAGLALDITRRKAAAEVLTKRAAELERFHCLSVGREMQMIELKKQINELAKQAGQKAPYELAFLSPDTAMINPDHGQGA